MNVRTPLFCALVGAVSIGMSLAGPATPAPKLVFNRDIRPILSNNCFACHGPDAGKRQAGLRLDGPNRAVIPGDAVNSALVRRVLATDSGQMPPRDFHKTLSPTQKSLLTRWIDEGGAYQRHWAYEPPVKPSVPAEKHPIDFLVRKRLEGRGLSPSPEADRRTLIRRLSFDLLGLPPTPQEVADFERDKSPDAYEKRVERLLASPHYGEKMAQGWLDAVRFADTIGYHSDTPRNIWPYRDWVIDSFNSNKPFDRFTREQLAGDLLPDASQETRVGSAFNRLLLTTEEGGAQPRDYEARYLTDRVRAVGTVWLGQTTGCANCHDHKFDPITQKDFFRLGAFFADIEEGIIAAREPGMPVATPEQSRELARREAHVAEIQKRPDAPATALAEAKKRADDYAATLPRCLVSVKNARPRIVKILPRGNFLDESGEVVTPATPSFLSPLPPPSGGESEGRAVGGQTRLDLADWIVSRENPLTARAVMNRTWKQFFGSGISRVLDDLGAQGEPPTNPALLDWLACEFQDSRWNVKHMVRLMVTSATYKQVSTVNKALQSADPYNREYARQSRFRLEAEEVRDNALFVAGLLSPKLGGPSVRPYQPERYWENLNFPVRDWMADRGENQYRRGLYTWWQRSFLHPSMLAFDAPSREECTAERGRSNIPQQALVLLNDPTYVEAARALAVGIWSQGGGAPERKVGWAVRQTLQREPSASERNTLAGVYAEQLFRYQASPSEATSLLQLRPDSTMKPEDRAQLAAWTHVARVLLNLHETITRP